MGLLAFLNQDQLRQDAMRLDLDSSDHRDLSALVLADDCQERLEFSTKSSTLEHVTVLMEVVNETQEQTKGY